MGAAPFITTPAPNARDISGLGRDARIVLKEEAVPAELPPLVQPAFKTRMAREKAAVRALEGRKINGGGVVRARTSWTGEAAHTVSKFILGHSG